MQFPYFKKLSNLRASFLVDLTVATPWLFLVCYGFVAFCRHTPDIFSAVTLRGHHDQGRRLHNVRSPFFNVRYDVFARTVTDGATGRKAGNLPFQF